MEDFLWCLNNIQLCLRKTSCTSIRPNVVAISDPGMLSKSMIAFRDLPVL